LRAILLIWAAAWLTFIVGYFASLALVAFGLYEVVQAFFSSDPTLASLVPLAFGAGLQLILCFIFLSIRDRFEHSCWELFEANSGASRGNAVNTQVLAKQTDGEERQLADMRSRQSRRLSKALGALIEQAWPDRTAI